MTESERKALDAALLKCNFQDPETVARLVCQLVNMNSPHGKELDAAAEILDALQWSHFGIEHIEPVVPDGPGLCYLNTGGTYSLTLAQEENPTAEVFVATWGDWVEEQENNHCADANEIRCPYCGEWTPCADEWRDTVCEHCGHGANE